MALRVLLADESTTIKKVMQLALQDFGVDVKSVPVGLDVVPVSKAFRPDIIFIDVLLQKKSGYEVAREVKRERELARTPVVLMWSGFMELDEAKAREANADRRLEKPFDADALRALVRDLVPRTTSNIVSPYLTFPPLPDFSEDSAGAPMSTFTPSASLTPIQPSPLSPALSMNADLAESAPSSLGDAGIYEVPEMDENGNVLLTGEDVDEFQTVPLAAGPAPTSMQMAPTVDSFTMERPSVRPAPMTPPVANVPAKPAMPTPATATKPTTRPTMSAPTPRGAPTSAPNAPPEAADENWSHQDLAKFKVDVPNDLGGDLSSFMIPAEDLNLAQVKSEGEFEEVTFVQKPVPRAKPALEPAEVATPRPAVSAHDEVLAEKVFRDEARAVIERLAWQMLPDIAERVIREELQKLLKDGERGP